MPSPIQHILSTYPSIKKEFDLTAGKYPATRKWFGKMLKKRGIKDKFMKADLYAFKWTLITLRKRAIRNEEQLFAAGWCILNDCYRAYFAIEEMKIKEERRNRIPSFVEKEQMTPIGGLVRRIG